MMRNLLEDGSRVAWGWYHIHARGDASKTYFLKGDRAGQRKFPTDWTKQFLGRSWQSQAFVACALVRLLNLMRKSVKATSSTRRRRRTRANFWKLWECVNPVFSFKFGPRASRRDESAGACNVGSPRGRSVRRYRAYCTRKLSRRAGVTMVIGDYVPSRGCRWR